MDVDALEEEYRVGFLTDCKFASYLIHGYEFIYVQNHY